MMLLKNGDRLLNEYINTLGIKKEDAIKIIESNKSAEIFLKQDSALGLTSITKNLGILLRLTLKRKKDDFSKLNQRDIDFISENYGFKIKY